MAGKVEYDKEIKAYHVIDKDGRKLATFKVWDMSGIMHAAIKAEDFKNAL